MELKIAYHPCGLMVTNFGDIYRCPGEKAKHHISNGYAMVKWNGRRYRVHRLVAECFVPNPNGLPQVDHKDGNKLNNRQDNLEWVSQSENTRLDHERRDNKPIQVIRNDGKIYPSMRQAAKDCGVDSKCIWAVVNDFQKTTGGYSFRRDDVPSLR